MRILDPILEEFMQNSKIYVTLSGQVFFYSNYETQIIIENFGKLRNIIFNSKDEMINYMIFNPVTDSILREAEPILKYMRPRKKELKC